MMATITHTFLVSLEVAVILPKMQFLKIYYFSHGVHGGCLGGFHLAFPTTVTPTVTR